MPLDEKFDSEMGKYDSHILCTPADVGTQVAEAMRLSPRPQEIRVARNSLWALGTQYHILTRRTPLLSPPALARRGFGDMTRVSWADLGKTLGSNVLAARSHQRHLIDVVAVQRNGSGIYVVYYKHSPYIQGL